MAVMNYNINPTCASYEIIVCTFENFPSLSSTQAAFPPNKYKNPESCSLTHVLKDMP